MPDRGAHGIHVALIDKCEREIHKNDQSIEK